MASMVPWEYSDLYGYAPSRMAETASAYNPTWRDRLGAWIMGDAKPSQERRRMVEGAVGSSGLGSTGMGLIDATPFGVPLALQEGYRAGDLKAMAMAVLPGAPKGVNALARGVERGAAKAAAGAETAAEGGIRAYHGSPHDFDRFDMSRIGTGEGAQAYGPGLYFAESEGVAKRYRDDLSVRPNQIADVAIAQYGSRDGAARELTKIIKNLPKNSSIASEAKRTLDALNGVGPSGGHMYEVRINANPDHFLDWDKPLSQQSEAVRSALQNADVGRYDVAGRHGPYYGNFSRAEAEAMAAEPYMRSVGAVPVRKEFSQPSELIDALGNDANALSSAGIHGVKYLDQGSRTAGEGTRNYVLFRDDIISIVKKYGIAAAAAMYGADAVNNAVKQGGEVY